MTRQQEKMLKFGDKVRRPSDIGVIVQVLETGVYIIFDRDGYRTWWPFAVNPGMYLHELSTLKIDAEAGKGTV